MIFQFQLKYELHHSQTARWIYQFGQLFQLKYELHHSQTNTNREHAGLVFQLKYELHHSQTRLWCPQYRLLVSA